MNSYVHASECCAYVLGFSVFQNAKESESLVTFTMDSERAIVFGETLSPPSNSEFAPAMVAHSTSMAENASTLVSLRMVCLNGLPDFVLYPRSFPVKVTTA